MTPALEWKSCESKGFCRFTTEGLPVSDQLWCLLLVSPQETVTY